MNLIQIAALIAATGVLGALCVCPGDWIDYSSYGSCYKFFSNGKNWSDAKTTCQNLYANGKLAEVGNQQENDFLVNYMKSHGVGSVWIGAQDQAQENHFVWDQHKNSLGYTNWGPNEPSNDDNEDCVIIDQGRWSEGKWDDHKCSGWNHPFFCEVVGNVDTGSGGGSNNGGSHSGGGGHVAFQDDFNGGSIDNNKWKHDKQLSGLGFEIYSPEQQNSYVKNGKLYICPTLTIDRFGEDRFNHGTLNARELWGDCDPDWGGDSCQTQGHSNRPIMSASMRSKGDIKYGRVEVRAKLPVGDWLWPAIWMMPSDAAYGSWPKSGEIDIMEAVGNLNLKHPGGYSLGVDHEGASLHYGSGRGDGHIHDSGEYTIHGTHFGADFHTYWADWTENKIVLGVDEHTLLSKDMPSQGLWNQNHLQGSNIWSHGGHNAPFDKPFYLILDVAVGGNYFWSGMNPHPPWTLGSNNGYQEFWNNRHQWLPTWKGEDKCMQVDSVKMIQY